MALANSNETLRVQPLLAGTTICAPSDNIFDLDNPTKPVDRGMNFICPNVAPGPHSIVMQFRSNGGGTVGIANRTTIVHYVR